MRVIGLHDALQQVKDLERINAHLRRVLIRVAPLLPAAVRTMIRLTLCGKLCSCGKPAAVSAGELFLCFSCAKVHLGGVLCEMLLPVTSQEGAQGRVLPLRRYRVRPGGELASRIEISAEKGGETC